MPKPAGKISAREILKDIRAGMDDSLLMEKYGLSRKGLSGVYRKLTEAGVVLKRKEDAPIPASRSLVPVRQPQAGEDTMQRQDVGPQKGKGLARAGDEILTIVESRTHVWLLASGLIMLVFGTAVYGLWPHMAQMWIGEIELAKSLNYYGQVENSYMLWLRICTKGGPIVAVAGLAVSIAGLLAWWLKSYRLRKLLDSRRYRML